MIFSGHCSELSSIYGSPTPSNLTLQVGAFWNSFVKHGDPNQERLASAPAWPDYKQSGAAMAFALPGDGGVSVVQDYRKPQCDYWETLPGGPDAWGIRREGTEPTPPHEATTSM